MSATLVLPAPLRELAAGQRRIPLPGATVGAMFDALADSMPMVERRIRDETGAPRRHLHVYVGDTDIRELQGLDTAVSPDTEVHVIMAVSGG